MEKYTMFMDRKNQYSENEYTTQGLLLDGILGKDWSGTKIKISDQPGWKQRDHKWSQNLEVRVTFLHLKELTSSHNKVLTK